MASIHAGPAIRDYLDRKPEKLLLEGFRQWSGGYETGCVGCWEAAQDAFAAELGVRAAAEPLFLLARLVRHLRNAGSRQMQTYPASCRHVCRDECCLMAMVSEAHGPGREGFTLAATALTGQAPDDDLYELAAELRAALAQSGLSLLPVPASVIESILGLKRANA